MSLSGDIVGDRCDDTASRPPRSHGHVDVAAQRIALGHQDGQARRAGQRVRGGDHRATGKGGRPAARQEIECSHGTGSPARNHMVKRLRYVYMWQAQEYN